MAQADATSRRFALMRKRMEQQERARTQQEVEGARRRFASIGGLGSGAAIKTEQLAQQAASKRLAEGREGLAVAEAGERQRQQEVREQREFQRGERLGSEAFSGRQAALGRQFSRGERIGSQQFAAGESALSRLFARGERIGSQEFARGERIGSQEFARGERIGSQEFARGERIAGQDFSAEEARLNRALTERGLTEQERANLAREEFQGAQITGQFRGEETQAAKQARLQRAIQEGQLTGTFGGKDTLQARLAKEQAALQKGIALGEIGGQKTLQAKSAEDQLGMQKAVLEEQKRAALAGETLSRAKLAAAVDQFEKTRLDNNIIADREFELKSANSAWQEQLARAEYDLNLDISMKNLQNATDALKGGGISGTIDQFFPGAGSLVEGASFQKTKRSTSMEGARKMSLGSLWG